MNISLDRAVGILRAADDIEILSHHYPDGDTLGSAAALCRALQKMGKKAVCRCSDGISPKYGFLFEGLEPQRFRPGFVVSVDVADIKLLGAQFAAKYAGKIDLCIDHHGSHQPFAAATYVDSGAAATCEIIYEIISRLGAGLDTVSSRAVYTGITTDTGCFRYSNTTARTHEIASRVMKLDVDFAEINRRMFDTKSRARLEMERSVLDSIEFHFGDRCAVVVISRAMIEKSGADEGDLEGLSSIPRQVEGVDVGVTMREKKTGGYKISLRTLPPVDAAAICMKFAGGGHTAAAGCTIDEPMEQAKAKILGAVGEYLKNPGER